MRKIFSFVGVLIALASIAPVSAEITHVTIDLTDGSTISYLLSQSPKIAYSGDSLFVSGAANASFELSKVNSYRFTGGENSAVSMRGSNEIRITYVDNSNVKTEGLLPNSPVVLYSISGAIVNQLNSSNVGEAELELPQAKGIYILKTNSQTVKLVKE